MSETAAGDMNVQGNPMANPQTDPVASWETSANGVPINPDDAEELRALVGKNIAAYEDFFLSSKDAKTLPKDKQKQYMKARGKFGNFAWLCLYSPFCFLVYRKLWIDSILFSLLFVGASVGIGHAFPAFKLRTIGVGYRAGWLVGAKYYVIWRYRKIIAKARTTYPDREERLAYLHKRGGTAPIVAWIAGILQLALIGVYIYYTFES